MIARKFSYRSFTRQDLRDEVAYQLRTRRRERRALLIRLSMAAGYWEKLLLDAEKAHAENTADVDMRPYYKQRLREAAQALETARECLPEINLEA